MERMDTSSWTTTNSTYGNRFPKLPRAALRPLGTDIGISRPWPAPNAALLSPRVSPRWTLEPGSGTNGEPQSREAMAACLSARGADVRRLLPSSQRDVARGYSLALHAALSGTTDLSPRSPSPSRACDAWWSLHRVADSGPRRYGADP